MLKSLAMAPLAAVALLGAALSAPAQAQTGAEQRPLTIQDEIVASECGDCHMAFSPGRLSMAGWKKIMANLSDHFGEDASLDAKTTQHIEAYMVSKAFDAKNSYPSQLRLKQWVKKGIIDPIRITETPRWTRHHNSPKYRRMMQEVKYDRGANCLVCHKNAERGVYEEFPGLYGFK